MSRQDALIRLHRSLVNKRESLMQQISDDLELAHNESANSGDAADAAQDGSSSEIHSQLAAFESRELAQIDRAIELIREGRYGECENCGTRIPILRLKALPFITTCIHCAQRSERRGAGLPHEQRWSDPRDSDRDMEEPEISINDIEVEL